MVGSKDTAFSQELHPVPPLHLDAQEITPQNLQTQVMQAYETLRRATLPMRQNPASAPSHSRGIVTTASPAAPQIIQVPHGLGRPHTGAAPCRSQGAPFVGHETVPGSVAHIVMGNPGSGYTTPPTVVVNGGGGQGVTAEAVLANGSVAYVKLNSPGQNHTGAPSVSFTGGGGTGATANAILPPPVDSSKFAQFSTTSAGTHDFLLFGD